jgi:hypothetical protein
MCFSCGYAIVLFVPTKEYDISPWVESLFGGEAEVGGEVIFFFQDNRYI